MVCENVLCTIERVLITISSSIKHEHQANRLGMWSTSKTPVEHVTDKNSLDKLPVFWTKCREMRKRT